MPTTATSARPTSSRRGSRAKVAGPAYRGTRDESTGPRGVSLLLMELPSFLRFVAYVMSARTTLLAGGDPFGPGFGFGGASGDAFAPGGEHGRVGGRGRQGDDDVAGEGGQQAGEDRLVGEDAVRRHQDDDGEPADGDGGEGALGGAAPPQQSAEDRHQQPADEQVVGDGQGLHDVVQRDRGEDHGDAHEQDEQAVAADLVVVVALRGAGEAAQPGPDVVVGDGRAGDERAGGRGHHRGEGGGQHQPAHPEGEFVLDDGGEGVV